MFPPPCCQKHGFQKPERAAGSWDPYLTPAVTVADPAPPIAATSLQVALLRAHPSPGATLQDWAGNMAAALKIHIKKAKEIQAYIYPTSMALLHFVMSYSDITHSDNVFLSRNKLTLQLFST